MSTLNDNIKNIETILAGLGKYKDDVIFIGGACTQFYVHHQDIHDARETFDVDLIIEIISHVKYDKFCEKLRSYGFKEDTSEFAPRVRWIYQNVKVDVLPDDTTVVGYGPEPWFAKGRAHSWVYPSPSGQRIKLMPLAYYFASKFHASSDRNQNILEDKHIEDIIGIIDARNDILEITKSEKDVIGYLKTSFNFLLLNEGFLEALPGIITGGNTGTKRAIEVVRKINDFLNS